MVFKNDGDFVSHNILHISQAEVIKLFNPNMYRDIILIDGCVEFDYSKIVTKNS